MCTTCQVDDAEQVLVVGFCEQGNEPSGPIKCDRFLDQLGRYLSNKNSSVPQSSFNYLRNMYNIELSYFNSSVIFLQFSPVFQNRALQLSHDCIVITPDAEGMQLGSLCNLQFDSFNVSTDNQQILIIFKPFNQPSIHPSSKYFLDHFVFKFQQFFYIKIIRFCSSYLIYHCGHMFFCVSVNKSPHLPCCSYMSLLIKKMVGFRW